MSDTHHCGALVRRVPPGIVDPSGRYPVDLSPHCERRHRQPPRPDTLTPPLRKDPNMTDTVRAVAAMEAKAQRARDEFATLKLRGYSHTTEAQRLEARAEAFEEAAAMIRHPAMAATGHRRHFVQET